MDEATADQCIDLAEQLVWAAVLKIVGDVRAFAEGMPEGLHTYGMENACEEIEVRIHELRGRWSEYVAALASAQSTEGK
jgi:uncharacterized hydantoinase/oxoprolinase family protein